MMAISQTTAANSCKLFLHRHWITILTINFEASLYKSTEGVAVHALLDCSNGMLAGCHCRGIMEWPAFHRWAKLRELILMELIELH